MRIVVDVGIVVRAGVNEKIRRLSPRCARQTRCREPGARSPEAASALVHPVSPPRLRADDEVARAEVVQLSEPVPRGGPGFYLVAVSHE